MDDNAPTETPEEVSEEAPIEEKKDRTSEQFDKLKQNNQVLKEERDSYKNLFESLRPAEVPQVEQFQTINQEQINSTAKTMIDENGMLDGNKLMQTLNDLDARAKRAEDAALQLKKENELKNKNEREREESAATLEVYKKYPQLNPNNTEGVEIDGQVVKFDPKMWQYVYNDLAATAKKGTMPSDTDYMSSADKVYTDLYEGRDMTRKEKEQADKLENQKRQINTVRPRSTSNIGYYENDQEDALVAQVRSGKRGAVGELLRRRGL